MIRSAAGLGTRHFTPFGILRNVQQCGAHLTCSGDRETTSFDLVATRDNIDCVLKYLASVATAPAFKHWQISDNKPKLKYEISTLTPQARTLDILHKAAFRTGLGNSLFVKKDHIDDLESETVRFAFAGVSFPSSTFNLFMSINVLQLAEFYRQGFTAGRASVVGFNVEHEDLMDFAQQIEFPCGDPPTGNSTYFGGEVRKDKNSYFAHVAVATQGVGWVHFFFSFRFDKE